MKKRKKVLMHSNDANVTNSIEPSVDDNEQVNTEGSDETMETKQPEEIEVEQNENPAPSVTDQGLEAMETVEELEQQTEVITSRVDEIETVEVKNTEPTEVQQEEIKEQEDMANKITGVVVEDKRPIQPTVFEKRISDIKEHGTDKEKNLIAALESYTRDMKPGVSQVPKEGARHQYTLYRTIQSVVNTPKVEDFKPQWNILLLFANEHKTSVFHDRYINRFSESWAWNETDLSAFQNIVHLIKLTADPATRAKGLKDVDLNKVLNKGFTEEGRQRVINFYR